MVPSPKIPSSIPQGQYVCLILVKYHDISFRERIGGGRVPRGVFQREGREQKRREIFLRRKRMETQKKSVEIIMESFGSP